MLGYTPSAYYQGTPYTLDVFGTALGTPGVWNARTGAGFGIQYESNAEKGAPRWNLAANYLADKGEGENSNPNEGGFMTDNSRGNITSQIAYGNKQWGIGQVQSIINNKVTVNFENVGKKVINTESIKLERISKPGLRKYSDSEGLPRVLNGLGVSIISTNKGVMTDKEARRLNIGGEILCTVY